MALKVIEKEIEMARNFRIQKKNKNSKLLSLHLHGDFDGASAGQLLYLLSQKIGKADQVTIDTSGLRDINTFGIDLFLPKMAQLSRDRVPIAFTGKFKSKFSKG